ncbi:MAG TPA: indole-3-glycerol phosphate synthase TrpC [Clostridiaceae bacterium]
MDDFLNKILEEKRKEVLKLKKDFKMETSYKKEKRSFISSLKEGRTAIIAEIKKGSPSKGMLNEFLSVPKQAMDYERYGANAISVLTDSNFFYGSFEYLREVREKVNIPVLCKDFIIDEIQINKANSCGADMFLLIAAAIDDKTLKRLYDYGINLGMEALVEVHNEEELNRVINLGATIIGINNRNLRTFKVDINTTIDLIRKIPLDRIVISESGIKGREEAALLKSKGVHGFLIGEALVTSSNLEEKFLEFKGV